MKQLAEIKVGSTVIIGGMAWNVLAQEEGKTLCIADTILEKRAFDDGGSNDWKKSSLRERLNGKFLNALYEELKAKGIGQDAILEQIQDLTTDDGLKDYGSSTDKVFLLTCEQYRQYRKYMRDVHDWWWLITADSTINNFARSVNTDGSLNRDSAYFGSNGVRPACAFSSSIKVDEEEE